MEQGKTKKPRRFFDQQFKVDAVRLASESGKSVAEVARELGINRNVLDRWKRAGKKLFVEFVKVTPNVTSARITISVAAGAVLEIVAGEHELGIIDGSGTTIVDPAATLTATSIVQDALIIGSTQMAAVPEPETYGMMLIGVGLVGATVRRRKQIA